MTARCSQAPPRVGQPDARNFTSQDFGTFLHNFRAHSSSPQISATLFGHSTRENVSLRKSPQNFRKQCADKHVKILARETA